jgi:hypothetical protein
VRAQVLRGKTLVFSHVIPLEEQRTPEAHAAWRLATELGASIQTQVGSRVTHIVAGSDGTDKVRWARSHGVHAVSIDWLASCGYLWRVVDEAKLPIDGKVAKAGPGERLPTQLGVVPPPKLATAAHAQSAV